LSPEEWLLFSRPLVLPAATPLWRNNTNALHFAKLFEGVEPGEDAASSPKENREENTMYGSKLSENLT
jgi:hypothetical protein